MKLANYPIIRFFEHFKNLGFDILVLRGYEELPERYGKDLDLAVPDPQYHAFVKSLLEFSRREDLRLFRYIYRPYLTCVKFYRLLNDTCEHLLIDILTQGGVWYGFTYLSNQEIFRDSRSKELWRIPSPLHDILLRVFNSMLMGTGCVRRKDATEVANRLPTLQKEFLRFMDEHFPGVDGLDLYEALVQGDEPKQRALVPKLKRSLVKRDILKRGIRPIQESFKAIFCEAYYYLQRNGIRIKLSGATKEGLEEWNRQYQEHLIHVWKGAHVRGDRAIARTAQRLLDEIELFRDRIIIYGEHFNGSTEVTLQDPNRSLPLLYRYLDQRNAFRMHHPIYRFGLWRFFGYRETYRNFYDGQ